MKRIYPIYLLLGTLLCLSLFSCARTSAGSNRLARSYTETIRKAYLMRL